jgi:hypothetical protein
VDSPSATAITTQKVRIQKIRWDGSTTGGTAAIVQANRAGAPIFWASTSDGSDTDADTFRGVSGDCDGVIVPTLTSGKLYIYYD